MDDTLRARRRVELASLLDRGDVRDALALQGTPLLLLDLERVRIQHRRLTRAFPGVRFHYALKALAHPALIEALRDEGSCFDIASLEELDAVAAADVESQRVIYTHPIKTPREIRTAYDGGVRIFVVDNTVELAKFSGMPADARILVRLAYRNASAGSDLSTKFGVDAAGAESLVVQALGQGNPVAGFSFHVGSQLDDAEPFRRAVAVTLDLMDALEARLPVRFDTLDIGGGIPAAYDHEVVALERIGAAVTPLLAERAAELDVIAEPGRIMVADAMTLVTSVIGIAERQGVPWYYLDDGLYGSYSNVLTEHVHPLTISEREARGEDCVVRATLAGPTCDSSDVISRETPTPGLRVGDLVLSPAMGAYTTVTASRFNGRPLTAVAPLSARASAGGPALSPAGQSLA